MTEKKYMINDEELIYGLMTAEFSGTELPDGFFDRPYGGVILFAKNIGSPKQLKCLIADIKERAGRDILISVDQEGGSVTRVNFPDMTPLSGNMAIGMSGSERLAFLNGVICGREIRDFGFNVDFAPCADINSNPDNPIIGVRSFGEDPDKVSCMTASFLKGLKAGGIIPCAKHFPGHGDTSFDSHLTMPVSHKTYGELEECELIPFVSAIRAGVPMIMTSHISFPSVDPSGLPATLSKDILTGILRNRLGFDGVIITDSMAMDGVRKKFGYGRACALALKAGADMLIACGSEDHRKEAFDEIKKAVDCGEIDRDALVRSFARIKSMLASVPEGIRAENPLAISEETARRAIEIRKNINGLFGRKFEKTLIICPEKFKLSPHSAPTENPYFADYMPYADKEFFDIDTGRRDAKAIFRKAEAADRIILIISLNGRLQGPQKDIADSLKPYAEKTAVISSHSPYIEKDLKWAAAYMNSFCGGRLSMKAAASASDGIL